MSPVSSLLLLVCASLAVSDTHGLPAIHGHARSVSTRVTKQRLTSVPVNLPGHLPLGVGLPSHLAIGSVGHLGHVGGAGGYVDPYTLGRLHGAQKGFQQGTVNGFKRGQVDGYVKGKVTGSRAGAQVGFHQGKVQGFHKGKIQGLHHGTQRGYQSGKIQGLRAGQRTGFKAGIGSVNRLSSHLLASQMPYMNTFGGSGYGVGYGAGIGSGYGLGMGSSIGRGGLSQGLISGHGLYGSGLGVAGGTVSLGIHQPSAYGGYGNYAPIHSRYNRNYGRNSNQYSRFH